MILTKINAMKTIKTIKTLILILLFSIPFNSYASLDDVKGAFGITLGEYSSKYEKKIKCNASRSSEIGCRIINQSNPYYYFDEYSVYFTRMAEMVEKIEASGDVTATKTCIEYGDKVVALMSN